MSNWIRRVWHLLNRPRYERELVSEMNEHRAAMHDPSKFGDTHRLLERSRDEWGWNWLDDAVQDLAVGFRMLMRSLSSSPFYLHHVDPVAFAAALAIFFSAATWPTFAVLKRNPIEALRHS